MRYTLAMTRASLRFLLTLIASALAFAQDKHVDPAPPHIYHVGEGVSLPKAMFSPTPEYTEEAAKKKIEGTVLVSLIVLPDGTSRNVTVTKGLGYGLDEQAVKAVSTWRFQPAVRKSDGEAVPSRLRSKLPSTSNIRKIDATLFNERFPLPVVAEKSVLPCSSPINTTQSFLRSTCRS